MRDPGSDGNLNVMFFKKFQIICLRTLPNKGEASQTLKFIIWELPGACTLDQNISIHFKRYCLRYQGKVYLWSGNPMVGAPHASLA